MEVQSLCSCFFVAACFEYYDGQLHLILPSMDMDVGCHYVDSYLLNYARVHASVAIPGSQLQILRAANSFLLFLILFAVCFCPNFQTLTLSSSLKKLKEWLMLYISEFGRMVDFQAYSCAPPSVGVKRTEARKE